jgi:hypothetical protein
MAPQRRPCRAHGCEAQLLVLCNRAGCASTTCQDHLEVLEQALLVHRLAAEANI